MGDIPMRLSGLTNDASATLIAVVVACAFIGAACSRSRETASYTPALQAAILQLAASSNETIHHYQGDESPEAVNSFWRDFGLNVRVFGDTLSKLTPPKNAAEAHKRLLDDSTQLAALAARLSTASTGLTLDNTLGSAIRVYNQLISDCVAVVQATQATSDCTQVLGGESRSTSPNPLPTP